MKKLLILPLLIAASACSKTAPPNSDIALEEKNAAESEDGDIKEEAKSIDEAADEAAAIVENEANEEIGAEEAGQGDEGDSEQVQDDPKEGE